MKEPIVIRKLRVLEHKELVLFRKSTRKVAQNGDLIQIAERIIERVLMGSKSQLILFDWIFEPFTFGSSKQNVLLNRLHQLLKDFIATQLVFTEVRAEVEEEIRLLKFFNDRRADEFVENALAKLESLLTKYPYEDDYYFYYSLRMAEERSLMHYRSRKEKGDLQMQSDAADLFYLSKKLVFCAAMVNAANINKLDYDYHMMEEVLGHLEKSPYQNVPTIYLWGFALRLLLEPTNRDHFDQLEVGLYESVDLLEPKTARNLFTALENSLRKMREKFSSYDEKLFQLYQFQIEKKIIYVEGFFPATLFDNMVTVSIRVKGPAWTEKFVEDNLIFVSAENRKESRSYNLSRCYFQDGEFGKCLTELKTIEKIKFQSIHLNLARRRLRIKALYEIQVKEINSISSQPERAIRALKKFLHTKKGELSAAHERANLDFARFVNRLTEVHGDKKIEKLRLEMLETRLLPEKDWLMEKLNTI